MSLPRELARLAIGTLDTTLNAVRLAIWVPIGLLLFVGIAGVVFAPVVKHLQAYWWVYLLAISALVAVIGYLAFEDPSHATETANTVSHVPQYSDARQTASRIVVETRREQSAGGRPTSGLALFRFTEEWISRNGLYEGRDMAKADAVNIAGLSAISYHLREGNFSEREGRIALTPKGMAHFAKRRGRL